MKKPQKSKSKPGTKQSRNNNNANIGFEAKLWSAADLLRSNMDPAEYKHVVLGLLFLKYISDAFEERREWLRTAVSDKGSDYHGEDPEDLIEDRDEYTAENVFWVPREARWENLKANATQPTIGKLVDDAMDAHEGVKEVMGDEVLSKIAHDLIEAIRASVTIDWTQKETVRARMRTRIKRLLRKHGYPPDKQDSAVVTIIEQAEQVCREWAVG